MLEEVRECAQIKRELYQQKSRSYYNERANICRFLEGEWVLKMILKAQQQEKFSEQWDGPFKIKEVMGKGTYRLRNVQNQKEVPRTWNDQMQKTFYQ